MQDRRGFTLVELLVVVAIITMLVAMLLPSLKDAQEQARILVCAANQRTLITGSIMYCQDNDGRLPLEASYPAPGSGPTAPFWDERLRLYLKLSNTAVFACPTVSDYWRKKPSTLRTYRMNVVIAGWSKNGPVPEAPLAIYPIQNRLVVFCESWSANQPNKSSAYNLRGWGDLTVAHRWALNGYVDTPWNPRPAKGGGNFAFADGHVDYAPYRDGWVGGRVQRFIIDPATER